MALKPMQKRNKIQQQQEQSPAPPPSHPPHQHSGNAGTSRSSLSHSGFTRILAHFGPLFNLGCVEIPVCAWTVHG
jgi:hypothetical protein